MVNTWNVNPYIIAYIIAMACISPTNHLSSLTAWRHLEHLQQLWQSSAAPWELCQAWKGKEFPVTPENSYMDPKNHGFPIGFTVFCRGPPIFRWHVTFLGVAFHGNLRVPLQCHLPHEQLRNCWKRTRAKHYPKNGEINRWYYEHI